MKLSISMMEVTVALRVYIILPGDQTFFFFKVLPGGLLLMRPK
jgi:hypothetical protein